MRPELDAALVKDFPTLYRDRHGSMMETCMCWGIDVGDGWEPLIRRLSEKLEPLCRAEEGCCASQVKEKFGTLRFYMTSETDEMSEAIRVAEAESAVTCEECGKPGIQRGRGWFMTRCDECAK